MSLNGLPCCSSSHPVIAGAACPGQALSSQGQALSSQGWPPPGRWRGLIGLSSARWLGGLCGPAPVTVAARGPGLGIAWSPISSLNFRVCLLEIQHTSLLVSRPDNTLNLVSLESLMTGKLCQFAGMIAA